MALSGTFSYEQYGEVATPLSITNAVSYGSNAMVCTIDIGAAHGILVTDTTGSAVGVYTPTIGRLRITGTAPQINTVLGSLRYVADTTVGYFAQVIGSVSLKNATTGVVGESGTLTLNANIVTLPTYTWSTAPSSTQMQVKYTAGSTSVGSGLPAVNTTQPYSVVEFKANGTVDGAMLLPQSERFPAEAVGKGLKLYASTEAVNTFLSESFYAPTLNEVYAKYDVRVFNGTETTKAVISPNAVTTVEYYNVGRVVYGSTTATEDTVFSLAGMVTPTVPVQIPASYSFIYTVNTAKISLMTANNVGSATSSWVSGSLTITGDYANAYATAQTVVATPVLNVDTDFTISATVTSTLGLNQTGNINVHVIAVNDAPVVSNIDATHTWREHDPYSFVPPISVIEYDTIDTLTATLVTSISQGSLSSNVGGVWNANTRTWSYTGDVVSLNSALANLTYQPTFLPAVQSSFSIAASVKDLANATVNGTLTMTCTPAVTAASNMTLSKSWVEDTTFTDFTVHPTVTSIDGNAVTVTFTTPVDAGWFTSNTGGAVNLVGGNTYVWSYTSTMANVNTAMSNGNFRFLPKSNYDKSFVANVSVRGNAVNDGPDGTITMTCTAVDDAPVVSGPAGGYTYNAVSSTNIITGISAYDPDTTGTIGPYTTTVRLENANAGVLSGPAGSTWVANTLTLPSAANTTALNSQLAAINFAPSQGNPFQVGNLTQTINWTEDAANYTFTNPPTISKGPFILGTNAIVSVTEFGNTSTANVALKANTVATIPGVGNATVVITTNQNAGNWLPSGGTGGITNFGVTYSNTVVSTGTGDPDWPYGTTKIGNNTVYTITGNIVSLNNFMKSNLQFDFTANYDNTFVANVSVNDGSNTVTGAITFNCTAVEEPTSATGLNFSSTTYNHGNETSVTPLVLIDNDYLDLLEVKFENLVQFPEPTANTTIVNDHISPTANAVQSWDLACPTSDILQGIYGRTYSHTANTTSTYNNIVTFTDTPDKLNALFAQTRFVESFGGIFPNTSNVATTAGAYFWEGNHFTYVAGTTNSIQVSAGGASPPGYGPWFLTQYNDLGTTGPKINITVRNPVTGQTLNGLWNFGLPNTSTHNRNVTIELWWPSALGSAAVTTPTISGVTALTFTSGSASGTYNRRISGPITGVNQAIFGATIAVPSGYTSDIPINLYAYYQGFRDLNETMVGDGGGVVLNMARTYLGRTFCKPCGYFTTITGKA